MARRAAIRRFTAEPGALRRMGQVGRAAMLAQGTWDAMGQRYLQLYRRLAVRPVPTPIAGIPDVTLKGGTR